MTPLEETRAAARGDWVGLLAHADALAEAGREAEGRLVRGRAWLWAWAESLAGWRLCFVEGRGRRPLVAHFLPADPARLRLEGWNLAHYLQSLPPSNSARVVFESPGHDVPADLGRRRRLARLSAQEINEGACAWLLPTIYAGAGREPEVPRTCEQAAEAEAVMAGAGVAEFCSAVEAAGGWWLPLTRNCAQG